MLAKVLAITSTSVLLGSETHAQTRDDTIELITRGSVPPGTGSFFELRPREDQPNYEVLGEQIRQKLADQNYVITKRSDFILYYGYRNSYRIGAPNDNHISFETRANTANHLKFGCHTICVRNRYSSSRHLMLQFELYRRLATLDRR